MYENGWVYAAFKYRRKYVRAMLPKLGCVFQPQGGAPVASIFDSRHDALPRTTVDLSTQHAAERQDFEMSPEFAWRIHSERLAAAEIARRGERAAKADVVVSRCRVHRVYLPVFVIKYRLLGQKVGGRSLYGVTPLHSPPSRSSASL